MANRGCVLARCWFLRVATLLRTVSYTHLDVYKRQPLFPCLAVRGLSLSCPAAVWGSSTHRFRCGSVSSPRRQKSRQALVWLCCCMNNAFEGGGGLCAPASKQSLLQILDQFRSSCLRQSKSSKHLLGRRIFQCVASSWVLQGVNDKCEVFRIVNVKLDGIGMQALNAHGQ